MKMAVIGAAGNVGSRIVAEALRRGPASPPSPERTSTPPTPTPSPRRSWATTSASGYPRPAEKTMLMLS